MRILLSSLALSLATFACNQNGEPKNAADAQPQADKDCDKAEDKRACEKQRAKVKRKRADDYPGLW